MRRLWHKVITLLRRLTGRDRTVAAPAPSRHGYRSITGGSAATLAAMLAAEATEAMARPGRVLVVTSTEREAMAIMKSTPAYDSSRHLVASPRGLCCSLIAADRLSLDEDIAGKTLNALDASCVTGLYGTVIVSEAQNLSPALIEIIDRITDRANHSTTYFFAPRRAIFSFAGASTSTLALLRARAGRRTVSITRREPSATMLKPATAPDLDHAVSMAVDTAIRLTSRADSAMILTRTNAEGRLASELLARKGVKHRLLTAHIIAESNRAQDAEHWRRYAIREADLAPDEQLMIATVHTARDRSTAHAIVLDTALRRPADNPADENNRLATGCSIATATATIIRLRG